MTLPLSGITVAFLVANEGVEARDFDALVLPGARGTIIAAICHGPWTLIDAGVVAGRTLAAWSSLATDLTNAGATWTAAPTHVEALSVRR